MKPKYSFGNLLFLAVIAALCAFFWWSTFTIYKAIAPATGAIAFMLTVLLIASSWEAGLKAWNGLRLTSRLKKGRDSARFD